MPKLDVMVVETFGPGFFAVDLDLRILSATMEVINKALLTCLEGQLGVQFALGEMVFRWPVAEIVGQLDLQVAAKYDIISRTGNSDWMLLQMKPHSTQIKRYAAMKFVVEQIKKIQLEIARRN